MRRVLHVPACDLQPGDFVSMGDSSKKGEVPIEERLVQVIISKWANEGDCSYYLAFNDDGWDQFCIPHKQFTLLIDT